MLEKIPIISIDKLFYVPIIEDREEFLKLLKNFKMSKFEYSLIEKLGVSHLLDFNFFLPIIHEYERINSLDEHIRLMLTLDPHHGTAYFVNENSSGFTNMEMEYLPKEEYILFLFSYINKEQRLERGYPIVFSHEKLFNVVKEILKDYPIELWKYEVFGKRRKDPFASKLKKLD